MGDLIVISVAQNISAMESERIKAQFINTMQKPPAERIIILGQGASISTIDIPDAWHCDYCHTSNMGMENCVACGASRVRIINP